MFYVDGYIPLTDVSRLILKEVRDQSYDETSFTAAAGSVEAENERNRAIFEYQSEGTMSIWSFCEEVSFVGVQTLQGAVLNASKQLLSWDDPTSWFGQNVNVLVGTVGSGSGYDDDRYHDDESTAEELLRHRFGDFLFLPVVFKRNEFDDWFNSVQAWRGEKPEQPGDHEEIATQIVKEFDNGNPVTKEWVKKNLAPDMKVEEFIATWKMAANQRPDLSKPGPRKQPK